MCMKCLGRPVSECGAPPAESDRLWDAVYDRIVITLGRDSMGDVRLDFSMDPESELDLHDEVKQILKVISDAWDRQNGGAEETLASIDTFSMTHPLQRRSIQMC